MTLALKIAWRNILRHRGKSIIIGVILFLGSLVMTVGNGVIAGMELGLEKNIIDGFTGDAVVISDKQENDNVLFTIMGKAIEPVNNYPDIKGVLSGRAEREYIEKFLPAGRNMATVLNEEGGAPGFAFLLGVDFEKYGEMFPGSMRPVEGRLLERGERGALVPIGSRKEFYNITGIWFIPVGEKFNEENFMKETEGKDDPKGLKVKDSIVFMGYNERNTTMDVRLDVKGIVRFKALDTIFGHYNFVDIESYRECQGYFPAATKAAYVPEEKKKILEMESENLDMLFGEGPILVAPAPSVGEIEKKYGVAKAAPPAQPEEEKPDMESGTYNLIFVKFKKGSSLNSGLERLNNALKGANLGVRAVSWKKAFGLIGSMAAIIKGALFVFVTLLFVVAVIIIVNTLTMAALERTSEIGMMRAIGARKSFISGMFLAETGLLSFVFGGAGIVTGIVIVNLIPLFNITSENDMVQLLFGGDRFSPVLHLPDITLTVIQLAAVTLLAVIYPLKVAKGITPLDAIARD